jgi:aspartyl-tRNA(Asn)/glutamyl-tRNA(Gln) amidotransferase subunit A
MTETIKFPWNQRDLTDQLIKSEHLIQSQGERVFTELFNSEESIAVNDNREGSLKNAIVSIKDLFDVKGYKTRAGSIFLEATEPASEDAEAVKALRKAGAYFIGHTNMTELAYSGLGLNPHYGTPMSPLYQNEARIAGGSTSGGAVSVALGIADIALGSDTGGSLRIPAAFCGVTGFKPTQSSVSRQGVQPLSDCLDSVGPIANTVAECELAWGVLANNEEETPVAEVAHFVIPTNFGLDQLDEEVKQAFMAIVDVLKKTPGVCVEEKALPFLDEYKTLPVWQFSAFEAMEYYSKHYQVDLNALDPRVASRLKRASTIDESQFLETCKQRESLIQRYQEEANNCVFLLPTVAVLPPKLDDLVNNEDYDRINLLCLRNTTLANVLDGCSVSLPYQHKGNFIGVMLTAANGEDKHVLSLAKWVERIILDSSSRN